MVSVKFIKPWSAYSPGDIAGFDEDRVRALIKCGAAELYEPSEDEQPEGMSGDAPGEQEAEQVVATEQAAEVAEAKPGRKPKAQ